MIDLSSVFNFFIIENLGVDDKDLFERDMILPADVLYRPEHGMDVDSSRKRGSIRSRLWP